MHDEYGAAVFRTGAFERARLVAGPRTQAQKRSTMTQVFMQGPRLRRMVMCLVAVVSLTGRIEPAAAQIYEWVDDANSHHFATSLESVPPEARSRAQIVVEEAAPKTSDVVSPSSASTPSEADGSAGVAPTTQRDKEASASFETGWDVGFGAGWDAGFRAAAEQQPLCPAEPEIIVLESRPPAVVNARPYYDPAGIYYRPSYEGSMTVPFDGGRSRGLTNRQHLKEQRRIERERGR